MKPGYRKPKTRLALQRQILGAIKGNITRHMKAKHPDARRSAGPSGWERAIFCKTCRDHDEALAYFGQIVNILG